MEDIELPLDLLSPDHQKSLTYWREQGGETLSCSYPQFDLCGLPSRIIPSTMVVDVFADTARNRYRFWGTRMTRIHGRDMTGRSPYELQSEGFSGTIRRQHQAMYEHPVPTASKHIFIRQGGLQQTHYTLRLPLSNDGKTLSQIVIIVDLSDNEASDSKHLF